MKTMKKLLSVTLSVLMALTLCVPMLRPASAAEDTVVASGVCGADGDNLIWTLTEGGVLTISGEGAMADYEDYYENPGTPEETIVDVPAPWEEWIYNDVARELGYDSAAAFYNAFQAGEAYMSEAYDLLYDHFARYMKHVVIEEGVTTIGIEAFAEWYCYDELVLPSTLVSIGDRAFISGHYSAVTLPEGLETVGADVFTRSYVTELTIPSTLQNMSDSAFSTLPMLRTLTVNNRSFDVSRLFVPATEGEAIFDTYEEYMEVQRFEVDIELITHLFNYEQNYSNFVPFAVSSGMPLDVAEDYVNGVLFCPAMLSMEFHLPGDTCDELMANAVAELNDILGTDFTPIETIEQGRSPALTTEVCVACAPLSDSPADEGYKPLSFYKDYMWCRLAVENYMAAHDGCTLAEAEEACGEQIASLFNSIKNHLGVTVTTLAEAQAALLNIINTDTGMNFAAEDVACFIPDYAGYSERVKAALTAKYGMPADDVINGMLLYSESLEDLTRENCQYVAAPWVTIQCCVDDFKPVVEAAGVNFARIDHPYKSEVTDEPSCTKTGTRTYTCVCCGDSYTEEIAMLAHTPGEHEKRNITPPTCTVDGGWDDVLLCSVCGNPISTAHHVEPATGHDWGAWDVIYQASEEEEGLVRRVCLNDPSHVEEEIIPRLEYNEDGSVADHIMEFVNRIANYMRGILDWFLRLFGRKP